MTISARAFTLIELLIVVAIIAILAAIAVPNFLASAPFGAPEVGAILDWLYDPTNGTTSRGNIFRLGGVRTGEGAASDIFITTTLAATAK